MAEYIVKTTTGSVKGYERDGIVEYLGIPYAKPPVGPLRFKRAVPVDPWEGVFEAKEYGPAPVQNDAGVIKGDEDCLTINVQRPAKEPAEGEKLPVLIYIYGGGFHTGSACDLMYNGQHFAKDGVLFFSLQYRLNVLGFYNFSVYGDTKDFESNCGISDQLLALHWIHDNIEAFGGDLSRVTINGESAGGASVINMLAAPGAKGLFTQAIAQSGLPNCVITHEMSKRNLDLYLEGMGMTEEDLPKLLTMDAYDLLKGIDNVSRKHQYCNPGMFLPGPIQDDLLPVRPIDAIRAGSADGVKLIIGTNKHEGTMFVHPTDTGFPNSDAMIEEMFAKNGHADKAADVIAYYKEAAADGYAPDYSKASPEDLNAPFVDGFRIPGQEPYLCFATDYAFRMPATKVAQAQRAYTKDVWMYRFDYISKMALATGWGAAHAFELPVEFLNMEHEFCSMFYGGEPESNMASLKENVHDAWVKFIKTGEPGWDRYDGYTSRIRVIDAKSRTEDLDVTKMMELWDDMRFYED